MTIEIQTPELEERLKRGIENGHFRDVDQLLLKALDALEKEQPAALAPPRRNRSNRTAVQRMLEFSRTHSVKLPPGETVVGLIRDIREGRLQE
jgi:hypothetical protein